MQTLREPHNVVGEIDLKGVLWMNGIQKNSFTVVLIQEVLLISYSVEGDVVVRSRGNLYLTRKE